MLFSFLACFAAFWSLSVCSTSDGVSVLLRRSVDEQDVGRNMFYPGCKGEHKTGIYFTKLTVWLIDFFCWC